MNKLNTETSFFSVVKKEKNFILYFTVFFFLVGALINYCYPYIDNTSDTGGYIRWAQENKYGGTRPLGYSHFIDFIHQINASSAFLFWSQLFLFFISLLINFYVVLFVFDIKSIGLKWTLFISNIFFISGIYSANLAMSDSLFLDLSILLISAVLLFIKRPNAVIFISILILLLYSIKIRPIAAVYPGSLILVFFLCIKKKYLKFLASAISIIVILIYVNYVKNRTEEDQGARVFSSFGGWQLASNALHVVPYLNLNNPIIETDDEELQFVDSYVRQSYPYFKHKYPKSNEVSYEFIWIDSLPLRPAFYTWRNNNRQLGYYPAWNYMGDIYNRFGTEVIKKYPNLFLRYYILKNTQRLIFPPNEVFDHFANTGSPGTYERNWFNWSEKEPIQPRHDVFRRLLYINQYSYPVLWVVFLLSLAYFLIYIKTCSRWLSPILFHSSIFLISFILFYSMASVFAAPINLRFLFPIRVAIIVFSFLMIHFYQLKKSVSKK